MTFLDDDDVQSVRDALLEDRITLLSDRPPPSDIHETVYETPYPPPVQTSYIPGDPKVINSMTPTANTLPPKAPSKFINKRLYTLSGVLLALLVGTATFFTVDQLTQNQETPAHLAARKPVFDFPPTVADPVESTKESTVIELEKVVIVPGTPEPKSKTSKVPWEEDNIDYSKMRDKNNPPTKGYQQKVNEFFDPWDEVPVAKQPLEEIPVPKHPEPQIFDKTVANQSLKEAANQASFCRSQNDPSGVAKVMVVFSSKTGKATQAQVNGPPFAGTLTGSCIAKTMRTAKVPPFDGKDITVSKTLTIK